VACILVLALCLGSAGCRLFGKKNATDANPGDRTAAGEAGRSTPPAATNAGGPAPPPEADGLLAGRVVDSYGSKPPTTYIQVVGLDTGKEAGAPIEVKTDGQGYFTIFSLRPGQHYKLVARAPDGERVLAGISYVTPPDPKVVIRISEDFNASNTPPPPSEPSWPGAKPPAGKQGGKPPSKPAATLDRPTPQAAPTTPPAPASPTPDGGSATILPAPVRPTHPEQIVQESGQVARNGIPVIIPPGPGRTNTQPLTPPPPVARVPSCTFTDKQLNFVLNDLDGQPWEFATRPHGRLVLLDFWGTWCPHCVRAIPELIRLKERYGSFGLDIIGVAYENEGSPEDQRRRLKSFRDRLYINYHLLQGGGDSCPLKNQLRIDVYPTLVLLDESGHVLWTGKGLTDETRLQLEGQIRWYLNLRR
jgi:thiol-disulfide isomerase/thioredoxin